MKSIKQKWVTLSGNALDMGSGAGVPGIVLSIYYNVLNVYSVDKSKIKTTFQERVKTRIGLTNYHPLNNRLERLTESAEHYLRYDFIISRAFDQLKGLLRFGKFFLKKDGYMILWKGKRWKLEWDSVPEETKREFLVVERTQYLFNSFDGGGTLLLIRKNN
jgi:16S rRNA (guanine527-N7)-methyltransferase